MFTLKTSQEVIQKIIRIINKSFIKCKDLISGNFYNFFKSKEKIADLVILDNYFPNFTLGFKVEEFNAYLSHFKNSKVYSTEQLATKLLPQHSISEVFSYYYKKYPETKGKILKFNNYRNINPKLFYCMFLENALNFIKYIESNKSALIFTLYPGGGFKLNNSQSDSMLRRVFSSTSFKKVIVTQKITLDYLVDNDLCTADKIYYISGSVISKKILHMAEPKKPVYKQNKNTFDICFGAYKYTPLGKDKGYDIFIEIGKILTKQHNDVRLHVFGGMERTDLNVDYLKDNIKFYGPLFGDDYINFFSKMDIFLSPVRANALAQGAFDGFPTTTAVDAGILGVPIFTTDPFKQNFDFKDRDEIVIINHNPQEIADLILGYINNYYKLQEIGKKGRLAFKEVYSWERQIGERIKILEEEILKI